LVCSKAFVETQPGVYIQVKNMINIKEARQDIENYVDIFKPVLEGLKICMTNICILNHLYLYLL
jgi:hypothetical protein